MKTILKHTLYRKGLVFNSSSFLLAIWSGKEFNNQGYMSVEIQACGYKINLLTCVARDNAIRMVNIQRMYSKKYPYFSKTM